MILKQIFNQFSQPNICRKTTNSLLLVVITQATDFFRLDRFFFTWFTKIVESPKKPWKGIEMPENCVLKIFLKIPDFWQKSQIRRKLKKIWKCVKTRDSVVPTLHAGRGVAYNLKARSALSWMAIIFDCVRVPMYVLRNLYRRAAYQLSILVLVMF